MDLWIRSQDKRRLIKTTQIDFTSSGYYGTMDKQYSILCQDEVWLGSYETKERALEVLDEIEKRLKNNVYFKESALELKNGFNKLYIPYEESSQVYQMPEE